jgi:hypothetical protein
LGGIVRTPITATAISQVLPASCASSVRFSLDSGSLPPGISLDPLSGLLSGTPTVSGDYFFLVRMRVEGTSFSLVSGMDANINDPAGYTFSGWELKNSRTPFLDDFRISSIGHTLYVVSRGFYTQVVETYSSSDGGASWTLLPAAGPAGDLRRFALASDGTGIYLSGGTDATGAPHRGVWYFDGTSWSVRTTNAAFPGRESHAMVANGASLYVMGGRLGTTLRQDTWRSADGGVTWTQASDRGIGERYDFCALTDNHGAMYVTGGIVFSEDRVGVFRSADGVTWTRLPVDPGSPLGAAVPTHSGACALLGDRIVLVGNGPALVGLTNTVSSTDGTNWRYEPEHAELHSLTPGAAVVDGRMYVTTGSGTSQRMVLRTLP